MRSHYCLVVIGGGIVGASTFWPFARKGWPDIALIERAEPTSGSTWLTAAGPRDQQRPQEKIAADCPIVDRAGLLGGLFSPHGGAVDPHGAPHAFAVAVAARNRGADVIVHNRALAMTHVRENRK